jgi:hypothetical protein
MNKIFIKNRAIFLFLIICCNISFYSDAQINKIATQVSKAKICINEPFLITFKIYIATDSFQKHQFPGFVILKGPTYSLISIKSDRKIKNAEINQYTIDTSHSSGLKYLLIPDSSGQLNIKGAVFYNKNKKERTPDTSVTVLDCRIEPADSIKIINMLWPETEVDKLIKEKVDSNKIDISKLVLTSDVEEMKVKLKKSFTITYKLNYLLFNKLNIDLPDFEVVEPFKKSITYDEINARKNDAKYKSIEAFTSWKCVLKPKKKGTYIIKPAIIYIKDQPIKSNEIKIIVK